MDGYLYITEFDADGKEISCKKTEFFAPKNVDEMKRLLNGESWDTIRPEPVK